MAKAETGFKLSLGEFSEDYVFVKTDAPKSYDYGYCIQVANYPGEARFVLIPALRAEYQRARYSSGLHTSEVVEVDESIRSYITDKLYNRLKSDELDSTS